jgi:hypothetical protein
VLSGSFRAENVIFTLFPFNFRSHYYQHIIIISSSSGEGGGGGGGGSINFRPQSKLHFRLRYLRDSKMATLIVNAQLSSALTMHWLFNPIKPSG